MTAVASPRPRASFGASVAMTYGANMGVAFLSLANVLVVARALGPEGRGTVTFLTTIAMMTSQLGSLGVEEASANLTGSRPKLRGVVAGNSILRFPLSKIGGHGPHGAASKRHG